MYQLSVIVPAWNAEKTLELCLQALENQTLPGQSYEIIVVDDGSTDSTAAIAAKHPVIYHFQENQGPAAARNAGALLSRTNADIAPEQHLIFFTDADCMPDPDWLGEMSAPFADPRVAAVKGAYRTEQASLIARFSQYEFEERFAMLNQVESIDMVDTYSAGFRKNIFQDLGGFDTRFPVANNEDTELSYRMAHQGFVMKFAPRAVVRHLNHPETVRRYLQLKFGRGYWRMAVYRLFPQKMFKDSYTPQMLKLQIATLFLLYSLIPFLPFFPAGRWLFTLALLLFIAATIPFALMVLRKDLPVGLLVPLLLALRATAVGGGVLWALCKSGCGLDLLAGRRNPLQ